MAQDQPRFKDGVWYRLKAQSGGKFENKRTGSVFFNMPVSVVGGEMASQSIKCELFLIDTPEGKKRFVTNALVLEFDAIGRDLNQMGDAINGKEFWGKCEIRPKDDGRGYWPPAIGEIVDLKSRTPGGPEFKAANILGNTVTKEPDASDFQDNF